VTSANKVVLVVDDDARIRSLLKRLFGSFPGVDCLEASNVTEAIELLNTGTVDAVVSDMNMPGESGLHILEHVRASHHRIPFMILSGSLISAEEDKLLAAGADIVLPKSIETAELKAALRELVNRAREIEP